MSLIKCKECKTEAGYRVVTCPNCGARIELKTMERRYMVLLLVLVVIFAAIVYLNRNIFTTSPTSLSSSQPNSAGVIEKKDEAEKVEAESPEKAEATVEAKVEALKAKAATQEAEAEQAKLAIKQKVNQSWIRPPSISAGSRCTIRVRLMSDGTVIDAEVISSSGDEDFDRSAENAVNKASPLPVPKDKELFARDFRTFQFLFNPK
jgi:TonB family protein